MILLIPLSFIGFFLTFGLSGLVFDQGGFAAMVMLCGLVVNAGIYLVYEYRDRTAVMNSTPDNADSAEAQSGSLTPDRELFFYLRSFRRKIVPISLTIISSVLGLLPFLTDGPKDVFWFNFAIGTIGGLFFSALALLLYFPVFFLHRKQ